MSYVIYHLMIQYDDYYLDEYVQNVFLIVDKVFEHKLDY
jgi:hypothetical protein